MKAAAAATAASSSSSAAAAAVSPSSGQAAESCPANFSDASLSAAMKEELADSDFSRDASPAAASSSAAAAAAAAAASISAVACSTAGAKRVRSGSTDEVNEFARDADTNVPVGKWARMDELEESRVKDEGDVESQQGSAAMFASFLPADADAMDA
jgi:hypothetical protein